MNQNKRHSLTVWLVRFLVVGAAIVVALPFVLGQLLPRGDRIRTPTCDNIYVALNGEVANELDGALNGGTGICRVTDVEGVIQCALNKHVNEDNPLNKHQRAYVWGNPEPCQVALTPAGPNGVMFSQVPAPGATTRSFSIRIE